MKPSILLNLHSSPPRAAGCWARHSCTHLRETRGQKRTCRELSRGQLRAERTAGQGRLSRGGERGWATHKKPRPTAREARPGLQCRQRTEVSEVSGLRDRGGTGRALRTGPPGNGLSHGSSDPEHCFLSLDTYLLHSAFRPGLGLRVRTEA